MEALFAPSSVAVIGASPESWYSSRLVDNLLEHGYEGDLYLVNPSRDEVWGRRCYDGVGDLPATPELVVVSVPRSVVPSVLREAGKEGVNAALVMSAGFAEADDNGRALEDEVADAVASTGIRVCGPNSLGILDSRGVVLTPTCSRTPEKGGVALFSGSGALGFTTFYERGVDEDVRFARVVSTGNETDLSLADFVRDAAHDGDVNVVCCYVEGTAPRDFVRAATEATASGTPVVAVKVGRSETADEAVVSHTGALTGDDDAWDAAFRRAGVERVDDIPDLLVRARTHDEYETCGDRLCVVTTSGGLGSLVADLAAEEGLRLPPLSDDADEALRSVEGLLSYGGFGNPVDVRGYGADHLPEIADAVRDDGYDAYLFCVGLSAVGDRAEGIADDLREVAERFDAPVFVVWTGRKGDHDGTPPYERLRREVPVYYDAEDAVGAVASLVGAGERRGRVAETPRLGRCSPEKPEIGDGLLRWKEATRLLDRYGVETVETRTVDDADEAQAAARALGERVVVKADGIAHRSDLGGVVTNIRADEVCDAYREVEEVGNGVLVQPQTDGVEAFVGLAPEDGFGNVVTVGIGGRLAETVDDTASLLTPVARQDARAALGETALGGLDDEDREALVDYLVRVGEFAAENAVEEFDLNPVMVSDGRASAVDVLMKI